MSGKNLHLICFLVLMFLFTTLSNAQNPFAWVSSYGSQGEDVGYTILEADSSLYVGGWFEGTVSFGSTTLVSHGFSDIFLVRMSYSGDIIWAKRFGGIEIDNVAGMCTDNIGNVYLSGFCSSYSDFGPFFLSGFGGWDAFICRVSKEGDVIWARSGGGYDDDQAMRVNVNSNGNLICVAGQYRDYASFGPFLLSPWGGRDIFISTLDSSGNFIWVENFGNYSDDIGYAVDIDSMGNVYAGGFYYSDLLNFGSTVLVNHGEFDCFLTKLNSYGSVCWAKGIGGINTEVIRPLKVDGQFLYFGGYHYDAGDFLGIELTSKNGSRDSYVVKSDTSGNGIWAVNQLSGDDDEMIGLSVIRGDGVYFCGAFAGILKVAGQIRPSQGGYDGYVVKVLESDGSQFGCVVGGGVEDDVIFGTFGSENGIYFTGYLRNEATFGSTVLVSSGGRDVVIGMLKNIPVLAQVFHPRKITVFPNPFNLETTINLSGSWTGPILLTIYNENGQIVKQSQETKMDEITINRGNLQSGLYFLSIRDHNSSILGVKLVIN